MRTSIRIIKRGQREASNGPEASGAETSVEQRTRELANTVKSWVAEFQQRERARSHPLVRPPASVTASGRSSER